MHKFVRTCAKRTESHSGATPEREATDGEEEGLAALRRVERTAPSTLAPDDVRVRAASLNYRDLFVLRGAPSRTTPIVPLSDGAGEVIAIGERVTRVRVGDRVAASFFPTWIDGPLGEAHHARALGGGTQDGMLAEEVVLPERAWVKVPAHLTFEEAATLPCAGVTAWHALFVAAAVKPGDDVLVQGTGGVSIFALQLARAAGARVIATSSSDEKRARLEALGAATTIDYRKNPTWGELVRAATGGRGVDIAVDVGGPGTFNESVKALRYGGTLSILGVLTGIEGAINTHAAFHKTLRVHGVYVGSVAMFEDFVRALEATQIRPVVDRTFLFDDAPAAYEHLMSGKHVGKIVIRV
jgi:NADPH:quinone reductase-like Zn-dependent oxidoreductase